MVQSCAAHGCTKRVKKGENISFHRFPTDPLLCKQWVIAINREGFKPSKYTRLCGDHFNTNDFVWNFGRKSLKPGVVPRVIIYPSRIKKKTPRNRSQQFGGISVTVSKLEEEMHNQSNSSLNTSALYNSTNAADIGVEADIVNQPQVSTAISPIIKENASPNTSPLCNSPNPADIGAEANILHEPLVSTEVSPVIRKRKRNQLIYMGDITPEDLRNPEKFERMWGIARRIIHRQRKRIGYLTTRVRNLSKRVHSLNDTVDHLTMMKICEIAKATFR